MTLIERYSPSRRTLLKLASISTAGMSLTSCGGGADCECTYYPNNSTAQVSTLAGSYPYGYADGQGTAAKFQWPSDTAIDTDGNIYVADTNNHRIRKITPPGEVTTFAGSGTAGYSDGVATEAAFNSPSGLAFDANNNLYVADTLNHMIRMITPDGTVTTVAGTGLSGIRNGTGTAASFNFPNDVAVDSQGNIFVADTYNNRIRKISPTYVVSTFAGSSFIGRDDGYLRAASFYYPTSIALDSSNNIYVADTYNNLIRKVDPLQNVSTVAGTGDKGYLDGDQLAAKFYYPQGIVCDPQGNIYVSDSYNNVIRAISPSGQVSTVAGNNDIRYRDFSDIPYGYKFVSDGVGNAAIFCFPAGLSINQSGVIYIADYLNCLIRVLRV